MSRRELFALAAAGAPLAAAAFPGAARSATVVTGERRPSEWIEALEEIDTHVARHVVERGAPGLVLALADDAGWRRVSSAGADPVDGGALATGALFQVGSLSKLFVAIAALRAAEEGLLDLDRPVRDLLPWLRIDSVYQPVTAHHLLTHTAGLPRDTPMLPLDPARPLWTSQAPGAAFSYSNLGYEILGRLLSTVEGRSLGAILRHRVLDPVGMHDSEPVITSGTCGRFPPSYAPLYGDRPFPRYGPLTRVTPVTSDGGADCVAATAADMCRFLRVLLRRGALDRGRLLSEKSFDRLTRPWIATGSRGSDMAYGYGVIVDRSRQQGSDSPILRHTGGMVSFSTALWADLSAGLAAFAAVPANLFGYRPLAPAAWAVDCLAAAAGGQELPDPPPPDDPYLVADAGDYVGVYTGEDGSRLAFAQDGDGLVVAGAGGTIPLQRLAPDVFVADHPDFALHPFEFGRREGEVVEVAHGGRWLTGGRYRGLRSFEHPEAWEGLAGVYRNDSPWEGTLRVFLRKGQLWLWPRPLVPLGEHSFRVGGEETSAERVRFDTLVGGRSLRLFLSEREYLRVEG
ncbi:MAG TPA: serine hydrolase domain-containing protein [Thermoanaerobaculia bacterium]|nr:serine hydrolase domain-containing protein [Thermoanaerobaculia bacterium]